MAELLQFYQQIGRKCVRWIRVDLPAVNVSHNRFPFCARISLSDVFVNPLNEVVLEGTFDDLVEKIG
jgi:hypothetical protein